jgi:hypothetical protein
MNGTDALADRELADPAVLLADDPRRLFPTAHDMYSLPYEEVEQLQLQALKRRFDELLERLPLLHRRAETSGVPCIDQLTDAGKLLYPSGVYKSYQREWLDSGDFERLTGWLQRLTSHDLSLVSTTGVRGLDDWFGRLEATTPLRVCHSSATGGKLSFVPRAEAEWRRRAQTMSYVNESVGDEHGPRQVTLQGMPMISSFYRSGHSAFLMSFDWNVRVHGDAEQVASVYPGELSSDLLVLGGRLREASGDRGLPSDPSALGLSVALAERWDELQQLVASPTEDLLDAYVQGLASRFGGQRVLVIGVWPTLVDAASVAARNELIGCFHPESIVHTGGGSKGRDLPGNAEEMVLQWLGASGITQTYGMSEIMGMNGLCRAGKYHLNAWTIPYVIDGRGQCLPRTGTQSGRFGAVDLMASSYWGGFLSSDMVTLSFDPTCACGRLGPYLERHIHRHEEAADAKVSCAATPALHDDVIRVIRDWQQQRRLESSPLS